MFKSRKKRQQQKLAEAEAAAAAAAAALASEVESKLSDTSKYSLLDDIHLAHDFRSSVILTQLNKDLDVKKLTTQQKHLEQLRDLSHSPISPPLSPSSQEVLDGSKQYQDLAAWRHERSQNRYSNGLFGGKQRGRPKPKKYINSEFIDEDKEVTEEEEEQEQVTVSVPAPTPAPVPAPAPVPIETVIENKMVSNTIDLPTMIQEQEFDFSDDEEPIKEMYEPDSDTEENFFFQDFSNETNNDNNNKKKKKKNQSRQRATKALSRFDLSSFARDLHDHRLSVIQPRDSKIIMTEDDELELEKLLEKQRQRMSMMTFVSDSSDSLIPPPPMPSLDIIKSHQKSITDVQPIKEVKEELLVSLPLPPPSPPQLTTLVTNDAPIKETQLKEKLALVEEESPIKEIFPIIKQENIQIKKLDLVQQEDEFITNTAPLRSLAPPRPSIPLRPSVSAAMPTPKIDQLKRSVSTTSMNSNNRLPFTPPVRPNASLMRTPSKLSARKSSSMDQIHIRLVDENEPSVTSAALDWIAEDSSQNPTSFLYKKAIPLQQQQQPPIVTQPIKSRGLFGSFRQVSRNKTHSGTSIKGLVRNFSSSHRPERDSGMSRAAMAVLQHNASKQEPTTMEPVIEQRPSSSSRSRVKSDINLISNLLSRAASSSSKRHNQTKIVNMEEENAKKRAQVVRRTIIYVQPDSLHDILKNGGSGTVPAVPTLNAATATAAPPLPKPRKQTRNTMLSDSSLSPDDETVRSKEYVTATKIVRQTSVRKRVVEDPEPSNRSISTTGTLSRHGSRRRYQLKSVEENEKKHSSDSSVSDNSDYLEGVELREMSDGSVVWGLVKKEGNRKSFYAPNQFNGYEQEEEEEEAEEEGTRGMKKSPTSSSSPPPIPKRSPRRQETTDIYYSNQMTLPSLLKMMQDQHLDEDSEEDYQDDEDDYRFKQRAMASVDDQLDEMMRILTSPQQQ